MFNNSIGIDLGTATVLIYLKGKGIILNEPSVVAYDKRNNKVIAAGSEAQKMLGRTPPHITAVHPLEDGVISSYTMTDAMLKEFLKKIKRRIKVISKAMICVPSGITDVEQRAVIETARGLGAKEIYIIDEPIAAAMGSGVDIIKPRGCMVVDIGGGTTDIAVISAGHIVAGRSLKIAGNEFNEAVIRFMRKEHNLIIGPATAEYIKQTLGTTVKKRDPETAVIKGLSTVSGLPKGVIISSNELIPAFDELTHNIIERIKEVLEESSPRLQSDILKQGIILTGGGAVFEGLDKVIEKNTGVKTVITDMPYACVARGAGEALNYVKSTDITFGRFYKKAYIYS